MSRDVYDGGDRLRLSPVTVTAGLSLLHNDRIVRWNMLLFCRTPHWWLLVHIVERL